MPFERRALDEDLGVLVLGVLNFGVLVLRVALVRDKTGVAALP